MTELGIDISHLNTCVLVGVPASATSLYQRIGRVGRNEKGYVIVVNTGDAHSEAIFAQPNTFLQRPLGESALYLENEYLQYIHALCLARLDGEHDQISQRNNDTDFTSTVSWPRGFIDFCRMERLGQVPKRLQFMKSEAGDTPNYVYPLRDVESQFRIEYKRGPDRTSLGSLSYSQLMREAYPGAVYYYATQPYRVYQVNQRSREVLVRKEKRYTTKPQRLPTLVFPNLTEDNILNSFAYGDVLLIECNLQIRESIKGIRERRGPNVTDYSYPLPSELGFYFDKNFFTRNFFTTGVVITHPLFRNMKFDIRVLLAGLLYEVFLLLVPFERQDINYATDKYRMEIEPLIRKGDPFIAIYDQTYGSLRLTSRLMQDEVIQQLFKMAYNLVGELDYGDEAPELLAALSILMQESRKGITKIRLEINETQSGADNSHLHRKKVIIPGSKGLNTNRGNEEFFVSRVFLTSDGLRYEGETETFSRYKNKTASYPFVDDIVPIPGVSQLGYYDELTGEVLPIEQVAEFHSVLPGQEQRRIEVEKLKFVLNAYFTEAHLGYLCKEIGLVYDNIEGVNKLEKVHYIVSYCDARGLSQNLLEAAYRLAMKLHGK